MNKIIGTKTRYNRDGSIRDKEEYSIMAQYGDRVIFRDNSYLGNCYINSPNGEHVDAAGAYKTPQPLVGKIVRTTSPWQAHYSFNYKEDTVIDMPIAVICDDGEIIYCNPLNIQVIEQNT